MNRITKKIILAATILTITILITWQVTGGDFYTKYQVVEEVIKQLDQNDPLVAAGFYENNTTTETIVKDQFRLGLFPTPSGIFDKHSISVVTTIIPVWLISIVIFLLRRRKATV